LSREARRDPFVAVCGAAIEWLLREISDVRVNLLELNSGADVLGEAGAVQTDPMGKMSFNILAIFAEYESNLIGLRTREGVAVARAKGELNGKRTKLPPMQNK
jgi:DNA invertase Pin-like site-specific DNA recombinase